MRPVPTLVLLSSLGLAFTARPSLRARMAPLLHFMAMRVAHRHARPAMAHRVKACRRMAFPGSPDSMPDISRHSWMRLPMVSAPMP